MSLIQPTPHRHVNRELEWACALVLLAWGTALLMPGHTFSRPTFVGFAAVATVPASLLTCAGEPAWRRGGTQRDVAGYVSDLRDAQADCADRLGAVGRIVAPSP